MAKCCNNNDAKIDPTDPCFPPQVSCGSKNAPAPRTADCPLAWFERMIPNCLEYAKDAKTKGRRIVGIMCEYTPRELIMAADAVPVCLCGGSAETIAPAEEHLPANLCPLIKSTYGYHVQKANPFLEMADLVVAETTCDGKKKMYELMAQTRPMHVLELPQKPDDADAMAHWISELRKLKAKLEELFHVTITDENIHKAIRTMNCERSLRRQLAGLMKADHPPLTGRQLLQYKSSISGICADFA
ncbi:MAG: 2-hydroxyacyl-CoA dehydratase, partial [Solirubrobacterales bacterium]